MLDRIGIHETKLLKQIVKRKLEYIGHAIRGSSGKELAELIKITATQRNTGRGRKRRLWYEEALPQTMESRNKKYNEMSRKANDRNEWKQYVKKITDEH